MILRCAIGVITKRGKNVIAPSLSELTDDEQDYLARHDDTLRARHSRDDAVYCLFRPGSPTKADLKLTLKGTDDAFVDVAARMTDALAKAMAGTSNAKDCVVLLMSGGEFETAKADHVTFLKLDAQIEAARLRLAQSGSSVRLQVFKDLLPEPGDLQKGFSWPDPRDPDSQVILHDTNRAAAVYFGNAFGVDISSRALDTERALVDELLKQLGPGDAGRAAALVNESGGRADGVVARIVQAFPDFQPSAPALGVDGAVPGYVRPRHLEGRKAKFESDGIELHVPLGRLDAVSTRPEGAGYITTVRTSTPLTPPDDESSSTSR